MRGAHHGPVEVDVCQPESALVVGFRGGAASIERVLELVQVLLVTTLCGEGGGRNVKAAADFDGFEPVRSLEAFAEGDFLLVYGGDKGSVTLPCHEESRVYQRAEGFPEGCPAEAQGLSELRLWRNTVSEAPFALPDPQADVIDRIVDDAAPAIHRHGALLARQFADPLPSTKRLIWGSKNPPFRKTSYECILANMTQITHVLPDSRALGAGELPETRLGVQFTRYPGHEDRPLVESLRAALDDGFTLVVLNSISAELSSEAPGQPNKAGELHEVAEEARHAGVELQLGLGCAGPFDDPAMVRAGLNRTLVRGLELGVTEFFVYTRSIREGASEQGRFLDHPAQLRLIRANLETLASTARDARVHINVKTHEDLASPEVHALVQSLDPAVFGIGFDVANLVVRGEDPVDAARALGPQVRMTHLEDAVLFPLPHGYRRRLRAVGEGVFDWEAILGHLLRAGVRDFTLEQHRGKFDAPVFDRSWFTHEPHLDAAGLGQLARLGVATHDGVARGRIPALADWDDEPAPAERRRQLLHSAATVRTILTSMGAGVKKPATILSGEEGLS